MTVSRPHPPAYAAEDNKPTVSEEKERNAPRQNCEHGVAPQTPYIDAQLQKPNSRAALLALSAAFAAAAEEDRCLKCAVESVVPELSLCMHDIKTAKKRGDISKDDKKALKKEMKWLFKDLKKEVKAAWKEKS